MEWIAAILGITGGLLIAYKMKSGFIVWIIGNLIWIVIGIKLQKWAIVVQFMFFEATAILGYIKWKGGDNIEKK